MQNAGESTAGRGSSKRTNHEAGKDQCICRREGGPADWKEGKEEEMSEKERTMPGLAELDLIRSAIGSHWRVLSENDII